MSYHGYQHTIYITIYFLKWIYINRGDWIVKNFNKVYDNTWITVRHYEVITPGGTTGIYGEVNFKNLAIGIIPIDHEGYA